MDWLTDLFKVKIVLDLIIVKEVQFVLVLIEVDCKIDQELQVGQLVVPIVLTIDQVFHLE
tara:strand:- start:695 stop:874 length:180 start_codon:yes stop_codon:yes gene_type:complete